MGVYISYIPHTVRWPLSEQPRGVAVGELPWRRVYRKWDEWPDVEPHPCHFCGDLVVHGYESTGSRHYLSDCRPDLVEHEIGDLCTWTHFVPDNTGHGNCYAYQDRDTNQWGKEHKHFYQDGPM